MRDYIAIQKLWYDNDLVQLAIVCSSAVITASAKIYVTNALIDDLVQKIKHFLNREVTESDWSNEKIAGHSITCVSLRFLPKDKLGHILIEVYMDLDDGGSYSSHNCCFYINTEIGLLEKFCKKLPTLKRELLGIKVVLNDND